MNEHEQTQMCNLPIIIVYSCLLVVLLLCERLQKKELKL